MKLSARTTATFTLGLLTAAVLAGCATTTISEPAPSPSVSVDRQAAAVSACAAGKDCAIGDIGPGGGMVFYDAGSTQSWGRYMETAPASWNGGTEDPKAVWCGENVDIAGALGVSVGSGAANTSAIVAACATSAASLADKYDGGDKTDWFLPSRDELIELKKHGKIVDRVGAGQYWSSSQKYAYNAWYQDFTNSGVTKYTDKSIAYGVRPVRAF